MWYFERKKKELETISNEKLKGHIIRSRTLWLQEAEKPSKYFCGLENKNYTEKTIKKIKLPNGDFLTDQTEILNYVNNFYKDLFSNHDDELNTETSIY